MHKSEQINELAAALVAAQAEMPVAIFDAKNPHFKNQYATLSNIVETSRPVLSKHGLSVIQTFAGDALVTTVLHKSGQWVEGSMNLHLDRDNMQGLGSAVTYARRYSWASAIGMVSDEDDDAQAAVTPQAKKTVKATPPPNKMEKVEPAPVTRWQDWVIPFGKTTHGKRLEEVTNTEPTILWKILQYMEANMADTRTREIAWVKEAINSLGDPEEEIAV